MLTAKRLGMPYSAWSKKKHTLLHMDFQLARNLSALAQAQQEAEQALLTLTSWEIVSIAKLLSQLPVQMQLSSWASPESKSDSQEPDGQVFERQ